MKKVLLLLVVTSCTGMVSAHPGLQGLQSENVHIQKTVHKNDQLQEECEEYNDNNLQEYEQHVCDNANPPQLSAFAVWMNEVGGNVLVQFIVLREAVQRYLNALKVMIANLLGYNNAARSKVMQK